MSMPQAATPAAPAAGGSSTHSVLMEDIGSLVNNENFTDAWERYRRGEQNVFSRRLYTIQGQEVFEEIRRRYRSETSFRDSTDRYLQQFEELIGELDRGDRTGVTAKSILLSNRGKVYTILAHAMGRLG